MKTWTIRQRILGSFALILVLTTVVAWVAYARLVRIEHEATNVEQDTLPALHYSAQMKGTWIEDYSLTQKHVILDDQTKMQTVETELQASQSLLESLIRKYETTIDTAKERQQLEAFKNLLGPYKRIQAEVLKLGNPESKEVNALIADQLDPAFEKVNDAIQAIADSNMATADESAGQILGAVTAAKIGILASGVVALLLAVICGYFLLQSVTRPLARLVSVMEAMRQGDFTQRIDQRDEFGALGEGFNRMANELTVLFGQVQKSGILVNTSATEIATTSKVQQATASEIAATTTEIGATSKEISATSKELVKTMTEVSAMAEQTAALAGAGQDGLSRMEETMHKVMEAVGSINAKLAVLNEKAGNINQVVTTITKVADQTNLLSLNAAIEAEKAGEYGRGFAVVATEIRRLADQTAVATYDIEQTVKEIQSAVSAGVMGMDKFSEEVRRGMQEVQQVGNQLSQIIQQVQALAPRFDTVNEGMQAQATGAEQISQALTQLIEAAQQTVESLRQSSQAIDGLNQAAGGLHSGVSRFKLAEASGSVGAMA